METINLSEKDVPRDPNESQNSYNLRFLYTHVVLQLYPKTPLATAILMGRVKLSKIQFNVTYSKGIEDSIRTIDQSLSTSLIKS